MKIFAPLGVALLLSFAPGGLCAATLKSLYGCLFTDKSPKSLIRARLNDPLTALDHDAFVVFLQQTLSSQKSLDAVSLLKSTRELYRLDLAALSSIQDFDVVSIFEDSSLYADSPSPLLIIDILLQLEWNVFLNSMDRRRDSFSLRLLAVRESVLALCDKLRLEPLVYVGRCFRSRSVYEYVTRSLGYRSGFLQFDAPEMYDHDIFVKRFTYNSSASCLLLVETIQQLSVLLTAIDLTSSSEYEQTIILNSLFTVAPFCSSYSLSMLISHTLQSSINILAPSSNSSSHNYNADFVMGHLKQGIDADVMKLACEQLETSEKTILFEHGFCNQTKDSPFKDQRFRTPMPFTQLVKHLTGVAASFEEAENQPYDLAFLVSEYYLLVGSQYSNENRPNSRQDTNGSVVDSKGDQVIDVPQFVWQVLNSHFFKPHDVEYLYYTAQDCVEIFGSSLDVLKPNWERAAISCAIIKQIVIDMNRREKWDYWTSVRVNMANRSLKELLEVTARISAKDGPSSETKVNIQHINLNNAESTIDILLCFFYKGPVFVPSVQKAVACILFKSILRKQQPHLVLLADVYLTLMRLEGIFPADYFSHIQSIVPANYLMPTFNADLYLGAKLQCCVLEDPHTVPMLLPLVDFVSSSWTFNPNTPLVGMVEVYSCRQSKITAMKGKQWTICEGCTSSALCLTSPQRRMAIESPGYLLTRFYSPGILDASEEPFSNMTTVPSSVKTLSEAFVLSVYKDSKSWSLHPSLFDYLFNGESRFTSIGKFSEHDSSRIRKLVRYNAARFVYDLFDIRKVPLAKNPSQFSILKTLLTTSQKVIKLVAKESIKEEPCNRVLPLLSAKEASKKEIQLIDYFEFDEHGRAILVTKLSNLPAFKAHLVQKDLPFPLQADFFNFVVRGEGRPLKNFWPNWKSEDLCNSVGDIWSPQGNYENVELPEDYIPELRQLSPDELWRLKQLLHFSRPLCERDLKLTVTCQWGNQVQVLKGKLFLVRDDQILDQLRALCSLCDYVPLVSSKSVEVQKPAKRSKIDTRKLKEQGQKFKHRQESLKKERSKNDATATSTFSSPVSTATRSSSSSESASAVALLSTPAFTQPITVDTADTGLVDKSQQSENIEPSESERAVPSGNDTPFIRKLTRDQLIALVPHETSLDYSLLNSVHLVQDVPFVEPRGSSSTSSSNYFGIPEYEVQFSQSVKLVSIETIDNTKDISHLLTWFVTLDSAIFVALDFELTGVKSFNKGQSSLIESVRLNNPIETGVIVYKSTKSPDLFTVSPLNILASPPAPLYFTSLEFLVEQASHLQLDRADGYWNRRLNIHTYVYPMLASLQASRVPLVIHNGAMDLLHILKLLDSESLQQNRFWRLKDIEETAASSNLVFYDTKYIFHTNQAKWLALVGIKGRVFDSKDSSLKNLAIQLLKLDEKDATFHCAGVDGLVTGELFRFFIKHDPSILRPDSTCRNKLFDSTPKKKQ